MDLLENQKLYHKTMKQEFHLKIGGINMCMYCERRTDVKFGWEQPKLPYHNNMPFSSNLNGNVLENDKWEAVVNIQLEKMKKNETNWERYCHIYGFGYKFLRVVHDMNISFKTFALSLDL